MWDSLFGGDAPSHCMEADQDFQQLDPTNNATGRGTAAVQSRWNETLHLSISVHVSRVGMRQTLPAFSHKAPETGSSQTGEVAPSTMNWGETGKTAAEEYGRGNATALPTPGAPPASLKSPPQGTRFEARVPLCRGPLTRLSLGDRNLEGASRDPDSAKEKKKTSPTLPVHGSSTRAHGSGAAVRHTLPAISHYRVAGTGSSQARWESDKAPSTRRSTTLFTSMRAADVESRVTVGQWYDTDKGGIAAKDMEERLKSKFGKVKLEVGKLTKDLTITFKCHQEKWAIKFPSIFPDSKAKLKGPRYEERVEMGPTTTKSFITQIVAIVRQHCSKCSRNQRNVPSRQSRSAKRECLSLQVTIDDRPPWCLWRNWVPLKS